jgi:serine/threonine-protein kinase
VPEKTDSGQALPPCFTVGDMVAQRYRLAELLGSGGCGEVFLAKDTTNGQEIALKTGYGRYAQAVAAEAEVLRALSPSPHIVRFLDGCMLETGLGKAGMLAMERVDGHTLHDEIYRNGPISVPRTLDIAHQICQGLEIAARKKTYHLDIKPGNIMLRKENGAVVLLDFGLRCVIEAMGDVGGDVVFGTPIYMSPEQQWGEEPDQRSDIYSLGVVLYEMITRRPAFSYDPNKKGSLAALFDEKVKKGLPQIPGIPAEVQALLNKMTAVNKEDRFDCISDLDQEIAAIGSSLQKFVEDVSAFDAEVTRLTLDSGEPITIADSPTTRKAKMDE